MLCDKCDQEAHTYCLQPPLTEIPPGSWYCKGCVDKMEAEAEADAEADAEAEQQQAETAEFKDDESGNLDDDQSRYEAAVCICLMTP